MCNNPATTFVEKCIKGEVLLDDIDDIDDFVDIWHEGGSGKELNEFLGMTNEEYSLWIIDPDVLPFIIAAREKKTNILEFFVEEQERLSLAARSVDPDNVFELMEWIGKRA